MKRILFGLFVVVCITNVSAMVRDSVSRFATSATDIAAQLGSRTKAVSQAYITNQNVALGAAVAIATPMAIYTSYRLGRGLWNSSKSTKVFILASAAGLGYMYKHNQRSE